MAEGWSKLLQLPPLDAVTRSSTTSDLPARTLGLLKLWAQVYGARQHLAPRVDSD